MIINGNKIERIVASGCSFTYGHGLEDRKTQSWPAQLAAKFDVECVNLGYPGMGNEYILSSILDYFAQFPTHKNSTLVIPCFSVFSRVEFCSPDRINYIRPAWTTMNNSKVNPTFTKQFFEELFNEEYYYTRYIRIILSLQEILKSYQTPYLMFEGLSGNPHKKMHNKPIINKLMDQIDRTKWLRFTTGNLDTMTDPNERLPCGHPTAKAYTEMADILRKHIINRYATE